MKSNVEFIQLFKDEKIAKFVDQSSIYSQSKIMEHWIGGNLQQHIKIQVSYD